MGRFARDLRRALFDDAPILLALAVICAAVLALLARHGVNGLHPESYGENLSLFLFFLVMLSLLAFCRELYRARPDSPIAFLIATLRSPDTARFFIRGLPMLLALVVFIPIFSAMKSAIPLFHAYNWDATLISADRALFGTDAWRFFQPAVGFPIVTAALAVAYHAWIGLIFIGGIYFNFAVRDAELRARYFLSFFAIWTVVGLALATGLASVGPCFVGPLLGDHTFDAQMAYLNNADQHYRIMVLEVQQDLLNAQLLQDRGLGRGISAMPSMHVALATLFALATWRINKLAGACFALFAMIIAIGSIHLAYHYAADGIVAAVVTLATWGAARPAASWMVRRSLEKTHGAQVQGGVVAA